MSKTIKQNLSKREKAIREAQHLALLCIEEIAQSWENITGRKVPYVRIEAAWSSAMEEWLNDESDEIHDS